MALTSVDRTLLNRCLHHEPGSWNDFVDRYLGLIYHVIHHTAHLRSIPLRAEDTEDIAAEVMLQIVANDYAMLRQFRGQASLATYLTVVSRRICIHELTKRFPERQPLPRGDAPISAESVEREPDEPKVQAGLESLEEVHQLLGRLPAKERQVVRLFYLEGRTYEEISTQLQIPVNSIGPILSRARQKMRQAGKNPTRP